MHSVSRRSVSKLIAAGAIAVAVTGATSAVASAAASGPEAATAAAGTRPVLRVPFHCGQEWRGATFSGHQLAYAIDFNQGSGNDDKGKHVLASAAGTVTASSDVGSGYGQRIIIKHAGGWSTLYAHLLDGSRTVSVGDTVAANKVIGKVGQSGGQSSSHLHYEQRDGNNNDQPIRFGQNTWVQYYATDYFTRTNDC